LREKQKERLCIAGASARVGPKAFDGCRWIGLDRGMPKQDAAATSEKSKAKLMRSSACV
jgi:hypothetical protein